MSSSIERKKENTSVFVPILDWSRALLSSGTKETIFSIPSRGKKKKKRVEKLEAARNGRDREFFFEEKEKTKKKCFFFFVLSLLSHFIFFLSHFSLSLFERKKKTKK